MIDGPSDLAENSDVLDHVGEWMQPPDKHREVVAKALWAKGVRACDTRGGGFGSRANPRASEADSIEGLAKLRRAAEREGLDSELLLLDLAL